MDKTNNFTQTADTKAKTSEDKVNFASSFSCQVLLRAVSESGIKDSVWGFYQSPSGQLEFAGEFTLGENQKFEDLWQSKDLEKASILDTSPGSTLGECFFRTESLSSNTYVYLKDGFEISDSDTFAFLTHVGSLLVAVKYKNTYVLSNILEKNIDTFSKFSKLTLFIIKEIAPETLFTVLYSGFENHSMFYKFYKSNFLLSEAGKDVANLLYYAAKEDLSPVPEKESPEEMFIRYFKNTPGKTITLPVIGMNFYSWKDQVSDFRELTETTNLITNFVQVNEIKEKILSSLRVSVQAEPYNPHDHNALGVYIDSINEAKFGKHYLVRAGYLRSKASAILRQAFPSKFNFKGKIEIIDSDTIKGLDTDFSIVVRLYI